MAFLIVLVILLAVVLVVTGPLRRPAHMGEREAGRGQSESSRLIDLEAAREAKYREIRDAELDHRTGKLSDADYAAVDAGLRAEAAEILHTLDRARAGDQVDS
jgi:hypothetical protein